jgi:predicted phage terminase large subunit-like protein
MALIGVDEREGQVYLINTFKDKIPFPEQVEMISRWANKYRPMYIGVEANAYQRVLVQQTYRLPGLPNIVSVFTAGRDKESKKKRIMAMSPLFDAGRVRIHRSQRDFIDQWISYDPTLSHPKDDLLDATEIALNLAGILLPRELDAETFRPEEGYSTGLQETAVSHRNQLLNKEQNYYDPELGAEHFV